MRGLLLAIVLGAPVAAQAQLMDHDHMHHEAPAPTSQPAEKPDDHGNHVTPQPDTVHDHAAGPEVEVNDPHAAHAVKPEPSGPPVAAPPAAALAGPAHAADLVFDPAHMARARSAMTKSHGAISTHKVMVDEFEWRSHDGADGYAWEGQAWFGGDIDRLWLKSKGEGEFGGRLKKAETQALWSHAIDPWFNLELGVRHDILAGPDRTYAVAGIQGLAPYWFEVRTAAFVSDRGEVMARLEADYDLRLTQRLILQPRAQLDVSAQDVPELRIGSGVSSAEIGIRLRYKIDPEFSPYVGLHYERTFGRTNEFKRADGEDEDALAVVVGVRFWF